jgi:membrane associated rhomboid family serine protease
VALPARRTLIPLGFLYRSARISAWVFIGVWFLMQFICGVASISDVNGGGVAYSAHVGGFLAGLLLVPLFVQSQRVDRRVYHGT